MSLFARCYDRCMAATERGGLGEWRRELLATLTAEGDSPEVLELGAGTGVNLGHYPPGLGRLVQTEPDRGMLEQLTERARGRGTEAAGASALELPYPNESFDAVVVTLVLCTVPDPSRALREAARVLRPGGRLLFIEHIGSSDPSLRRWQGRVEPVWKFFAGGCHLTRDPRPLLVQAGLELESCQEDHLPKAPALVSPAIRGVARRLSFRSRA